MRPLSSVFAALLSQANKFKLFPPLAAGGLLVALTSLSTHAQTCAPAPSGMVAWWPGDGNAVDLISGGAGTLAGGATYGTLRQGKVSLAFSFSGSGRVSLTSAPSSNVFTIDAWVNPKQISSPNGYRTIYADDARGLRLLNGRINWWGSGGNRFTGNNPIPINTWTHIALTYNGGVFTAYRNGEFDGQASNQGEFLPTLGGIGIGGHNYPVEDFDGLIDEVEIFNRVLDQSEIKAIYDAGSAGKCKIPQKKGMTWIHSKSDATTGTITVGCGGCDGYHGDTVCTELRPLLCIYKPTPPFQLPKGLDTSGTNNMWSGGLVATTQPVAGNKFKDIKEANSFCAEKFGKGWRVAEFHDGGMWNFQAYGGTVSAPKVPSTRFWVYINDQKDGNCWK